MTLVKHAASKASVSTAPRSNDVAVATHSRRGWKVVALELATLAVLFLFAASFALLPTVINLWRHS